MNVMEDGDIVVLVTTGALVDSFEEISCGLINEVCGVTDMLMYVPLSR